MTEMLEKEFSRTTFLRGGGALIVGLGLGGAGVAGKAQAATKASAATNIPGPPDPTLIDSWLAVHPDNTVSIFMGKHENGTGTATGTAMIVAEELSLPVSSIHVERWDSGGVNPVPSQGPTVGSNGIASGGRPMRAAAAAAASALLNLASTKLGVPVASLSAENGVVSGGGRSATYGELIGGQLFNVRMPSSFVTANTTITAANPTGKLAAGGLDPGVPGTKPVAKYTTVGTNVPRIDIPDKVTGKHTYVQNIRVPDMLHGRVVRPRGQAAYVPNSSSVVSIDESSIKHIPGAKVVRRGNFVGVIAPMEYDAIQAAAQLKVKWADPPPLPSDGNLWSSMRATPASNIVVNATRNVGDVDAALASSAKVLTATYAWPFNIHGVIGPSAAVADVSKDGATLLCQFQGGYDRLRPAIAETINLPVNSVRLIYYEGASTFGHNGSDHAAVDAAIMSQIAGRPVRVQHMRWDEHGWDNYSPAVLMDVRAGLDANGKVTAYEVTGWQPPAPGTVQAPGSEAVGFPIGPVVSGPTPAANGEPYGTANMSAVNLTSVYAGNIANQRVKTNSIRMLFRSGTMRGPGFVQPSWAFEQMMDELAYAAKTDPIAFRAAHVSNPRWAAVLTAVAQAANWKPRVAASSLSDKNIVTGRGVSLTTEQSYGAVIADVTVNKTTGKVLVTHMYAAQENGFSLGPDLVANQMSGNLIMATGRTLHEQMKFNTKQVTGVDWVTYPILRFKDHPKVTTVVIQRTDLTNEGVGEALSSTPAPAIANAFFDATGVRIREAPLTPVRVRAVLAAGGSGPAGLK
jgi:CO/xanthine dehydrogenase Mo-binding subunit